VISEQSSVDKYPIMILKGYSGFRIRDLYITGRDLSVAVNLGVTVEERRFSAASSVEIAGASALGESFLTE
jgi:hypothetical protein